MTSAVRVAIVLVATLGWPLAMSRAVVSDFYVALAVLCAGIAVAAWTASGQLVARWFSVTWQGVMAGLAGGVLQAVVTHAAYPPLAKAIPVVREQVSSLYALMDSGVGPVRALPIIVFAIVIEELVWRGVAVEGQDASRADVLRRAILSASLYAIAQAGIGSWVLVATAFACGMLWWIVRHAYRSLTPALLMHLIWSLVVLVLVPLESAG